ncbi:MAG: response regulator transcription factor, partial [Phycisphaerales bacterium]|nr:response regulator transcription factor [Phycisphaerales bacterium]
MRKIRIILADDHPLIRDAIAAHVRASGTIEVLAQASTSNEAVEAALRFQPDIVVLDIDMPGMVSFNAARRIRESCPSTLIIFLSAFTHDHYIAQAIEVNALAYVRKEEPTETIVRAIHLVAEGRSYYSPSVQERIIVDVKGPRLASPPETRLGSLTAREMEVLKYIATGMSKK